LHLDHVALFVPATGRTETEWQKALKKKIRDKRSKKGAKGERERERERGREKETLEGLGTQREGTGRGRGREFPRRWTKEERDRVGGYDVRR